MFNLFEPSLKDIEERLRGRPRGETFRAAVDRLNRLYSGDVYR